VVITPINPLENIADLARPDAITQVLKGGIPIIP